MTDHDTDAPGYMHRKDDLWVPETRSCLVMLRFGTRG